MKALRDIYDLKIDEPFKQLFTQGMITHKLLKPLTISGLCPVRSFQKMVFLLVKNKREIEEGPCEKCLNQRKMLLNLMKS